VAIGEVNILSDKVIMMVSAPYFKHALKMFPWDADRGQSSLPKAVLLGASGCSMRPKPRVCEPKYHSWHSVANLEVGLSTVFARVLEEIIARRGSTGKYSRTQTYVYWPGPKCDSLEDVPFSSSSFLTRSTTRAGAR